MYTAYPTMLKHKGRKEHQVLENGGSAHWCREHPIVGSSRAQVTYVVALDLSTGSLRVQGH